MKTSTKNMLQKATSIFFILSLGLIAFSIADVLLLWFEVLEITVHYQIVWLAVIGITLVLLAVLERWKKFFLLIFLGLFNFLLLIFVIFSAPISIAQPLQNSEYFLKATKSQYKILEQHCCYEKVIATKPSDIFFTPNMKTGLVPTFEAKLLSETHEMIILEIKTSGVRPKVQDTITRLK